MFLTWTGSSISSSAYMLAATAVAFSSIFAELGEDRGPAALSSQIGKTDGPMVMNRLPFFGGDALGFSCGGVDVEPEGAAERVSTLSDCIAVEYGECSGCSCPGGARGMFPGCSWNPLGVL